MKKRNFGTLLGGVVFLSAACAESAIPMVEMNEDEDVDASEEPIQETDAAAEEELDARTQARRDARVDASDDEELPDAGTAAGRDAQVRDAALDAAGPRADASTTKPDAAGPDAGNGCSGNQMMCGGSCVNTATSSTHCGGCGMACSSGQTCSDGACTGGGPSFTVPNGCMAKTFGTHGYAFCTDTRSWGDARGACRSVDLDLAIVNDEAENDFVRDNASGEPWLAANDRSNEGQWRNVQPGNDDTNGSSANFTKWGSGEPNNTQRCDGVEFIFEVCFGRRSDEDCAMLRSDSNWNDDDCDARRPFVCETY